MAYKVIASASADSDLDEILTYIAETLFNPQAASDFADELDKKYDALEKNPLMFALSQNERLAQLGYRRFVVGSYVILYLVDEERMLVTIMRIFYGRRNYEQYI